MSEPRPWHRLFGLSWMDFCKGTSLSVEMELDLSLKQQFLDLVIIRQATGQPPRRLPDGFEILAVHNLVTFKSHQETLDVWALCELVGHYVNYRKQSSPSLQELLPETDYRLFAVCARYPQNLEPDMELTCLQEGVYEVRGLGLCIRVIVASQLPRAEHNARLHMFSAREDLLQYGRAHYRPYSPDTSSVLYQLLKAYREDPAMSDKLKEFVRQTIEEILAELPAEERLKGLPAEERLKGLSPEEVVRAIPPEALELLNRQRQANGSTTKPSS